MIFLKNSLYPLPDDKLLDVTKLKAFADDKFNVDRMLTSLLDRVENTVGKEENADYQHFLLFPQCFAKPSSLGSLKFGIVWYRVNSLPIDNFLDLTKFQAFADDK